MVIYYKKKTTVTGLMFLLEKTHLGKNLSYTAKTEKQKTLIRKNIFTCLLLPHGQVCLMSMFNVAR